MLAFWPVGAWMGVLFLVYVISYIDRQLMSVLLEPIKIELHATDTEMGILTGVAFAIFYAIMGIPIARLADRSVRRSIIAAGVTVWSVMTVLTGFSRSYAQILVARIFVGVGEAAGGAPGHSLISDYFPPSQRATALALYSTGGTVGIMLGMWLGGYLGFHYGWRVAFFALGMQPIENSLFAVLTPERWRSTAYGLKFVLTFGVGSSAVWMVRAVAERSGWHAVYGVLAWVVLALVCFVGLLFVATRGRETRNA